MTKTKTLTATGPAIASKAAAVLLPIAREPGFVTLPPGPWEVRVDRLAMQANAELELGIAGCHCGDCVRALRRITPPFVLTGPDGELSERALQVRIEGPALLVYEPQAGGCADPDKPGRAYLTTDSPVHVLR